MFFYIFLPVLQRRLPRRPFERTQKMLHAVVAHRVADLVHAHIGFLQQLPRGGNAQAREVVGIGYVEPLFEQRAEIFFIVAAALRHLAHVMKNL